MMEAQKRHREQIRRVFSRTASKLENSLTSESYSEVIVDIEYLKAKYHSMQELNNQIQEAILSSADFNENLFSEEIDQSETYTYKWFQLKKRADELISNQFQQSTLDLKISKPNIKLPKLQLAKFDDNPKHWIGFWAQFKKIHEDSSLSDEDKYQYLLQSMQENSQSKELVESFPPVGNNYNFAIQQLKERFGNTDILIQIYIREIIKLVLTKPKSLKCLYDKLSSCILSLESLNVTKDKFQTVLYPLIEAAIPENLVLVWNRCHDKSSNQLTSLLDFLKNEVETEERIKLSTQEFSPASGFDESVDKQLVPTAACIVSKIRSNENNKTGKLNCVYCSKNHTLFECYNFCQLDLDERKKVIMKKGHCLICFKKGHLAKFCKIFTKCLHCHKRHNIIMCPDLHSKDTTPIDNNVMLCHSTPTLLQTLVVSITYNGKSKKVRALLDSKSQRTYIKSEIAQQLQLRSVGTESIMHTVFGGEEHPAKIHRRIEVQVSSLVNSFSIKICALELDKLCGHLPKLQNAQLIKKLKDLNIMVSDTLFPDTDIGLLIGSDYLGSIITDSLIKLNDNLMVVNTKLGWTIQGPTPSVFSSVVNTFTSVSCLSECNITDLWNIELLGIRDPYEQQSKAQSEILNMFNDNISVNDEGRFEVKLLWKNGFPELSPNYEVAHKRLESITQKLNKSGYLSLYNNVFENWHKEGIIEEVIEDNIYTGRYLPHHTVIKLNSISPVRPVFDASSKDYNGLSLNGCLEKGLNMIELIPKLLILFRKGVYGVTSDIKQAFLQISVSEEDRNFLKFLWWQDPKTCDKLIVYRHCRVVFGVTCSPFLLSASINFLLDNCPEKFKQTAQKLKNSFYVDNCVTSFDSIDKMNEFILQAKELLLQKKFDLRGWVSTASSNAGTVPLLGMMWDVSHDHLLCNVALKEPKNNKVTKRKLLSIAQQVFDPLGLFCPVTLIPKLILQEVWQRQISWDQEIPADLAQKFWKWRESAYLINECRIPRRLSTYPIEDCDTSLHVFCDSSAAAYAACVYLRTQKGKEVNVQLIIAKSRIAPANKQMSVPRLELMGAVIASRLYKEVIESGLLSQCKNYQVYLWSDSAVVLAWITRQTQWKPFVSNRITEVRNTTNIKDWNHLPGCYNIADLPSRGCNAKQLLESRRWFGPTWLKLDSEHWPRSVQHQVNEEMVKTEQITRTIVNTDTCLPLFSARLMYFSSYVKIVRLIAWIFRLNPNVRKIVNRNLKDISNDEFIYAEQILIKLLQKENFKENYKSNLVIITDENGIMRVKTRLELGSEHRNFIFPILLPGNHEIVYRLVRHRHQHLNHAGIQVLMSNIRNDFWILNIRRLAKRIVSSCIICKRSKSKCYLLPEPPLPVGRIEGQSAFHVTGIDLAGPLFLKNQDKCWLVLFTCATYRAVHFELVESLSTNCFIMALRRFMARRGRVHTIYTDNGTNFRGAANLLNDIDWSKVEATTSTLPLPIKWRFSVPRAPWWGGWWERLIRTTKEMLRRMLGKSSVTYIELLTLLCDCEAVINSRPLTYVATDDESLRPLTPMLFLQGLSTNDTPDIDHIDSNNINIRLRYLQNLRDSFRQRFKKEYLGLLTSKNCSKLIEPKVGDIVLIETESPRVMWPLGIVNELFTGTDGHTRVAKVQTATGERVRAYQKLYPLELAAVTDEWKRPPSVCENGKPDSHSSSVDMDTSDHINNSNVNDFQRTSRFGRKIKIPHRFLDG